MKRLLPAAIVLAAAVLIAFIPAFQALYVNWDDSNYVGAARMPFLQIFNTLVSGHYHPLTMLTLAVDVRLFGMNPTEMHAVNIALHLITAVLVLVLLHELTGGGWGAFAGALFFAIHPLRVESVAWISERKDVLMGVFYVAALLAYVSHLKRGTSIGWTYLLFVLALLAKGTALSLPVVLLFIDVILSGRPRIVSKIPMFILSVVAGVGAVVALRVSSIGPLSHQPFSAPERFVLSCRSAVMYLQRIIVPLNLSAYYPFPHQLRPEDWWSAIAVVGLVAAVIASYRRFPRLFAGLAIFAVTIAPMLPLLATGDAMACDRYTYLPSIGLGYVLALGVMRLSMRAAVVAIAAGGLILGALTFQRCKVWHDGYTLWSSVIDYDPNIALAWNNLGGEGGEPIARFIELGEAIRLDPCYIMALKNRAKTWEFVGNYAMALRDIDRSLRCEPKDGDAWGLKARFLREAGRDAEAQQVLDKGKRITGVPIAVPKRR